MKQFFVQGKIAQQFGGCVHIGLTGANKPFCGHTSFYEQSIETDFELIQPDDFEKRNGCPPRIQFDFLEPGERLFRDDFCQKCYKKLLSIKPELLADFRFK